MNEKNIRMMGKQIELEVSAKAERELATRKAPLFVEMELYFSCLLRKHIRIYEETRHKRDTKTDGQFSAQVTDNLYVSFRPVMTKTCSVSSCGGEEPPVSDFPIEKPQSYVPKWLRLDYRKGQWCGDFGY